MPKPSLFALNHAQQAILNGNLFDPHRLSPSAIIQQGINGFCNIRFSLRAMMSGALFQ
ncbi:MAG: hypothetical protein R3E08_09165 [Thiotrichaceae bacterium]